MNRHCYRIIFNRSRRMLVVVSELARAAGGDTGRGPGGISIGLAALRPLTFALWLAGGVISTQASAGTISADRSAAGGQQPTILQTGNGLPQVNIQTPNSHGLSHNKYSQFDVNERGAILNNSQHATPTQLAGQVAGNPWLAKGAAKVILNEVNSTNPSQLRGFVEVAGQKADVIIANPAGISCSGCGFINAGRNTLAAGRVRLENGQIAGYDVDRGRITISGAGMNGTGQDYTRLIARAVEVNGRLQAGDLKVTTGRNQTDAEGNVITIKSDDPQGRPQFAIDTAALAGMYANRITLVGTEQGVGVQNRGEIGATQGGFTLDAQGKLTNTGTVHAQQALTVNAKVIDNSGQVSSTENIALNSGGDVVNAGQVRSDRDIQLTASGHLQARTNSSLIASGNNRVAAQSIAAEQGSVMGAGIDGSGKATLAGQLSLTADQTLTSQGTHLSRDSFTATGSEVNLSHSQSRSATIAVTARNGDLHFDNAVLDAQQATLTTQHRLSNRQGQIAADQLAIQATEAIDNSGGYILARGNQTTSFTTQQLTNQAGTLVSRGNLSLQSSSLDNNGGLIQAEYALSIDTQGGQLTNTNTLSDNLGIRAGGALTLNSGDVDNQNGLLTAEGINAAAKQWNNQQGQIISQQDLKLQGERLSNQKGLISAQQGELETRLSRDLDNQQGTLQSSGQQNITADYLNNDKGKLLSATAGVTVQVGKAISNQQGQITAGKQVNLSSNRLQNQQGRITAVNGDLRVTSTLSVDNSDGVLQSLGALELASQQLINRGGTLQSAQAASQVRVAGELDNQQGTLSGATALQVTSGVLNNQQGVLLGKTVDLISQQLNNRAGLIQGSDALQINTQGQRLDNSETYTESTGIRSGGYLQLFSGELDNHSGLIAGQGITLASQALDNRYGTINSTGDNQLSLSELNNLSGIIQSGGNMLINTSGAAINNQQGKLLAEQQLTLKSGAIDNQQGVIQGGNGVAISGTQFTNRNGQTLSGADLSVIVAQLINDQATLYAQGDAQLSAQQQVTNQQGLIKAGQTLSLQTAQLDNQNTRGDAQGIEAQTLHIVADRLDNRHGSLRAGDLLQAEVHEQLNNQSGLISSLNNLTLGQADGLLQLNNAAGDIVANGDARLQLAQFDQVGRITSGGNLSLEVNSDFNQDGQLAAGEDFTLDTHGNALTNSGSISAGQQLTLRAGSLDNQTSGEINAGITAITATDILNQGLIDGGEVRLTAQTLHNTGTGRIYGDALTIDARSLTNDKSGDTAGTIAARQDLTIATDHLLNQDHGLIYSNGGLHIGGTLDQAGMLTGQADQVDNLSATIEAMGDLQINARQVENRDIYLTVSPELQTVSTSENILDIEFCTGVKWNDACGRTDGVRYRFNAYEDKSDRSDYKVIFELDENNRSYAVDDQGNRIKFTVDGKEDYVYIYYDPRNSIIYYNLPGYTSAGRRFNVFEYNQVVKEQVATQQDSAVIRSGGNLTLNSALHNKDSQVVAGQALTINGAVDNDETTVKQEITQVGNRLAGGKRKQHKETRYEGPELYQPPVSELTVPLHLTAQLQGQGASQGVAIDAQKPISGIGQQASGLVATVDLAQRDNQTLISEVAQPVAEQGDTQLNPAQQSENWVIRNVTGPITVPDSSLYVLHPGTDSQYLVETDPKFTKGKAALSSGDFYSQDQLQKRLGDGYYEQTLVREQIMKATGQRFLSGYSNDEEQYRALLSSGKAFAEQFNIAPGTALSAEQMARMTTDIVLMVNQTVTLADGSKQVVSVPKLYARVNQNDLNGNGTLLAGNSVQVTTANDVLNSGTIKGRELTSISATNLLNIGEISGNNTQLLASNDIVNRGGQLIGGDQLSLQAGHDILSVTESYQAGSESWLGRQAGIRVTGEQGDLRLNAGHDVQLTASVISNQGKESTTQLTAGHDINLDSAKTSHATDYTRGKKDFDRSLETQEIGSVVNAGGSLSMLAGHDMTLQAAEVTAGGEAKLLAGNNINLLSGENSWDQATSSKTKKRHGLSKTTTEVTTETHQKSAVSSTVSGDSVTMVAGNDLRSEAGNILGTQDVSLSAGRDLTLTTAAESDHSSYTEKKKKSGISGTGGIGFTVGTSSQKIDQDDRSNVQKGSVVGSSNGNLLLSAGNGVTVHGSDLVAGQDMTLRGKNVDISAAENSHTALTKTEQKSSGLTLALGGMVGSAINTAVQQGHSAAKEDDGRLAALKGTQALLTGYGAKQADELNNLKPEEKNPSFGVSLSYGSQSSHSEQKVAQQTSAGSTLNAGRDLTIQATEGNIDIAGSQLKAGRDTLLDAARDITLHSAANNETVTGSNASHGGSLGVGIGVNSGSAGISVSASVNASKGKENGSTLQHNETTLDSGRQVTLHSGRDTTLTGAQVNGEQIVAEVGRNLTLTSEQDSNRYDSKQQSASVGGSYSFGTTPPSGSLNLSQDKMHSTYNSVQEQTGLFAGKGGFDVTVGAHTQLNGAVIGSTASAENNRLETGTLGFSDIDNHAAYEVEHQSVGISSGGGLDNFIGNLANGLAVAGNKDKSDSSMTHAAVSAGTIIINDTAKQQQNVDDLSRDVEHANQILSPIFDKEKEQKRMQTLQLIGEIGNQAADIARTQGEIAGLKAKTDPAALQAARAELVSKGNANPTSEQIAEKAYKSAKATFGTGSAIQQAITAATAAIQGLAGGDIAKALAGGAAPYIAEEIHKLTTTDDKVNKTANLMAHAVVNAALSLAKGENALAGASSAVTAEAVGMISQAYYGKKPSELTDEQKQKISALASLAAGLAGGLVGGDTASAVSGAQTGKVTVENNYLSTTEKSRQTELIYKQNLTPQEKQERDALNRKDSDSDMAVYLACNKGGGDCQAERAKAKEAQDTYFNQTYLNPKEAQAGYKQIENLLESTDPNAKEVFNILDGYTQAFMTFGYTEEEARARASTYVGSIYVLGGMSAVLSSNSLTKQFGKDVAADAKPSGNTTPKIDVGKGTTGTGSKAGEYLDDFKPSPTPGELVQQQAGKGTQVTINTEHILNGEIKTYANGTKVGTGGHYLKDPNIKVDTWTGVADANGVTQGYISVRDQATGKWVQKKAETTFFPEQWSKRQTEMEIKSAFENSKPNPDNKEMWQGMSSSGLKMEGYYKKPDGTGATAWPVYQGAKK